MTGGSQQLRRFRIARRNGASTEEAAAIAGMSIGEARLHADADDADPPPPEAFELLNPAPVEAQPKENDDMARPRKKQEDVEQVHAPDFGKAVRIYRGDIKPAQAKVSEHAQEQSTAYKAIKNECHVQPGAARQAFALDRMEESKRDDWLRSFNGLLKELNIFMPRDLADIAEGKADASENVVPFGDRRAPMPVTMQEPYQGDDSDLADAGEAVADEREQGEAPAEAAE